MKTINVFLDDLRVPGDVYKNPDEWVLVGNVDEVISMLQKGNVSKLSLDNDLGIGQREGYEVVRWMIENDIWPLNDVFVHSANVVRSTEMKYDIDRYFYNKRGV